MGMLINGDWKKKSVITSDEKGAFDRKPRTFLDRIHQDDDKFKPASGRYHLYVSYACPWAHRTLIYRALKDLESHISLSVVHPDMLENGWSFDHSFEGSTGDTLYEKNFLYEIYQLADSNVTTSVTVPVLWDKELKTIVNNESSEIIRIFNSAFNELTGNKQDFYPEDLRSEIDELNDSIYDCINNGVYKAGFAKEQSIYDKEVKKIFMLLDELDDRLEKRKYLLGDQLTEADLRLVPSLLRFDPVYNIHFKCSKRKISEYPNLSRYLADMYSLEAVRKTTHLSHVKRHYYYSHKEINPFQIIPLT